jgi:hypothetical protein
MHGCIVFLTGGELDTSGVQGSHAGSCYKQASTSMPKAAKPAVNQRIRNTGAWLKTDLKLARCSKHLCAATRYMNIRHYIRH